MLKLQKKIKGTICIFLSRVVTYESLPASLQSFKKNLSNHFKKSPGEGMVYDKHCSFGAVSMLYGQCYADVLSANLFNQMFTMSVY